MRVGLIAPPWIPVPPPAYGGIEAVVDGLARGLAARGHDVRLFTVGESTCPVRRSWVFDRSVQPMGASVAEAAHVLAAYEALADCDVIHDHTLVGPLTWARTNDGPLIVTTGHGEFTPATRAIYAELARRVAVVAISNSQRASAPEVPVVAVIHHGIDLQRFRYGPGGGGYLLFVGRMSPDKGVHEAIGLARRASRRLVVVTRISEPVEHDYFVREVKPLLGPDIDLRTDVSFAERVDLLRHAEALLNPIRWPEPFGLVMAEALACGTPVLAHPNGAAAEIVEHGRTGYLSTDDDALVAAPIDALDRHACRRAAEEHFSLDRMAADHECLYQTLLSAARPPVPVGLASASTDVSLNGW